jgi:WD40 repeat protein
LAAVAERALARNKDRYQTAKELADEIEAFQNGARVEAYRYSSWTLLRRFIEANKPQLFVAGVALVVSSNGEWIFAAGGDKSIRAYERSAHRAGLRLDGHEDRVLALAVSADGRTLLSAAKDKTCARSISVHSRRVLLRYDRSSTRFAGSRSIRTTNGSRVRHRVGSCRCTTW